MELIRGQHNLRSRHRDCVATIGNFDGVHLGHQAVFDALRVKAIQYGLPSTVILFEPQPMEFFQPDKAPARLTRLREKLIWVRHCGVNRVLLLEFNRGLAALEAEDFVHRILLDGLGVRHLFVGDDFRFGRERKGDFHLLQEMGDEQGFGVESMSTVRHQDSRISSTRIRQALLRGDLREAEVCLGRPYQICGRVAHGRKLGRSIGFPTLNIHLHRRVSPVNGVFAVRVQGLDEEDWPGVANVGTRPTVSRGLLPLLEVHLFDFSGDLYGRQVGVTFVQRIREEKKFDAFDELKAQIAADAAQARQILG